MPEGEKTISNPQNLGDSSLGTNILDIALANPQIQPKTPRPTHPLKRFLARLIDGLILGFIYLGLVVVIVVFLSLFDISGFQNYVDHVENTQKNLSLLSTQTDSATNRLTLVCIQESSELCTQARDYDYWFRLGLSIVWFFLGTIYFIAFNLTPWQASLGKKLLKIKIIDQASLGRVSILQSTGREIFWILYGISQILISINLGWNQLFQVVSSAMVLDTAQGLFQRFYQTIHDRLAQTVVVDAE